MSEGPACSTARDYPSKTENATTDVEDVNCGTLIFRGPKCPAGVHSGWEAVSPSHISLGLATLISRTQKTTRIDTTVGTGISRMLIQHLANKEAGLWASFCRKFLPYQ